MLDAISRLGFEVAGAVWLLAALAGGSPRWLAERAMNEGVVTPGGIRVAASDAKVVDERKGGSFLKVKVSVTNQTGDLASVTPLYFTVTACGRDTPVAMETFGLEALESMDLQIGSRTDGWLAFPVESDCKSMTLNFANMKRDRVRLSLVL